MSKILKEKINVIIQYIKNIPSLIKIAMILKKNFNPKGLLLFLKHLGFEHKGMVFMKIKRYIIEKLSEKKQINFYSIRDRKKYNNESE